MYFDKWWYKFNRTNAHQMIIEKIEDDITDYEITEQVVKRGCTPEVQLTLEYEI